MRLVLVAAGVVAGQPQPAAREGQGAAVSGRSEDEVGDEVEVEDDEAKQVPTCNHEVHGSR